MELLISLIAGAVGGTVIGGLWKRAGFGFWGAALAGVIGGFLGWQLWAVLDVAGYSGITGGTDGGLLIGRAVSGGVGGGAVLAAVGLVRSMLAK